MGKKKTKKKAAGKKPARKKTTRKKPTKKKATKKKPTGKKVGKKPAKKKGKADLRREIGEQLIFKLATHDPEGTGLGFEEMGEEEKKFVHQLVSRVVRNAQVTARRHTRMDTRLDVRLRVDDQVVKAETKDLSLGGMFLVSDAPVSAGDELEFVLFLPAGMPPVEGRARVVHTRHPAHPEVLPGFGLQFLSVDTEKLRRYLVGLIRGEVKPAKDERRRHGRIKRTLSTHLTVPQPEERAQVRNISLGGVLLETEIPAIEGTRTEMTVIHPLTLQKLRLTGKVVRVTDSDTGGPEQIQGTGVAFDDMESNRLDLLLTFLTDLINLEAL
jgi:c-di-GMP-binding flagellar brake protein YcgR